MNYKSQTRKKYLKTICPIRDFHPIISDGKDVIKLEPSCIAGETVKFETATLKHLPPSNSTPR